MSKSVLFLTNAYPDFDSSYRGIFVKQMGLHLKDNGFRVSIVTPKIYKRSLYFEKDNGISVYRFPFFASDKLLIEHRKIPYLRMLVYYLNGIFLTLYVILRNHCSLIHVHWAIPTGPIGAVAGRVLRKPLIVTIHGSDLRMAVSGAALLRKIFVFVCQQARHVHLVSESMKNTVEGMGIPPKKISVWPMGIDEIFLQSGKNRKRRRNDFPAMVLSNRNLLPIYDVSCLIRAIPLVLEEEPGVRFVIAGEGVERENLEMEAQQLSLCPSLQFVGRVAHMQMPDLLARTDVYVSTSLCDGTSVSLMEALAAGAFPVVTDIPANREWITDGENGFLVPVRNERKLADRIIEAIRNPEFMERAGRMNQEVAKERAHWGTNVLRIAEIYGDSLES